MNNDSYEDIINLPHHRSSKYPHMSMEDRAAQFAPFAALNGHAAVISHTGEQHVEDVNTIQTEDDYLLYY
ncbi:MAG: hypothetical protein K6F72_05730 [Bacteroidales bacterium]|nr:hypothetical protein [Bacteroidales bacterium]